MKRTVRIRLPPDPRLMRTVETYAAALQLSYDVACRERTANKTRLHHLTYRDVRTRWPELPSSLVQCARDVAAETAKRLKFGPARFSFKCRACGLDLDADLNAARNIAGRACPAQAGRSQPPDRRICDKPTNSLVGG